jgi:hypothetical protein
VFSKLIGNRRTNQQQGEPPMKKFNIIAAATIVTAIAMFCAVNTVEARGPSVGAIVRDHRVAPIVRDNRVTPIVRDHRTPPCQGKACK